MTGKEKPKKHTAKEIAAKVDATMTNRGGGKAGVADRTGKMLLWFGFQGGLDVVATCNDGFVRVFQGKMVAGLLV
ncbi:hypothetical protein LXL04_032409 [Taraxacum kok-saghyz]